MSIGDIITGLRVYVVFHLCTAKMFTLKSFSLVLILFLNKILDYLCIFFIEIYFDKTHLGLNDELSWIIFAVYELTGEI